MAVAPITPSCSSLQKVQNFLSNNKKTLLTLAAIVSVIALATFAFATGGIGLASVVALPLSLKITSMIVNFTVALIACRALRLATQQEASRPLEQPKAPARAFEGTPSPAKSEVHPKKALRRPKSPALAARPAPATPPPPASPAVRIEAKRTSSSAATIFKGVLVLGVTAYLLHRSGAFAYIAAQAKPACTKIWAEANRVLPPLAARVAAGVAPYCARIPGLARLCA